MKFFIKNGYKENLKFAIGFILCIAGIVLVDLLLTKILFSNFFEDKDYGFQNRTFVVIILSIISSVIITHFEHRGEKTSASTYIITWICGASVITCISGAIIWIINLILIFSE